MHRVETPGPVLPTDLPRELRRLAELAEDLTADAGAAKAYRRAAEIAAGALLAAELVPLDLKQASRESGYSASQLRRLLGFEEGHEQKIPNVGTREDPRILRAHLPRRPGHNVSQVDSAVETIAADPRRQPSSRTQVARSVANGEI